jgi:hypothetical protein
MLRLLALLPIVLLASCGGGGRAYYQTRYIPTSSETTFSSFERSMWTGDLSVYELPAAPPNYGDEEPRVRDCCATPGPKFKPQTMVAYGGEVKGSSQSDQVEIGGWDDRQLPAGGFKTQPPTEIGTQGYRAYARGTVESEPPTKIGQYDDRPKSVTGVGLDSEKPTNMSSTGRRPVTDYCYCGEKISPDHHH